MPAGVVFVVHHARDLGDYVAAPLHFRPIADLDPQALDFIHVVQRGTADGCAADSHRLQLRDGRELAGAADLNMYVLNLSDPTVRGIFVCNRPARRFSGETQLALDGSTVHLDDYSIDLIGQ